MLFAVYDIWVLYYGCVIDSSSIALLFWKDCAMVWATIVWKDCCITMVSASIFLLFFSHS